MIIKIESNSILGGGGFGIILKTQNDKALKLIKNVNECESLKQEIYIHKRIEEILTNKSHKNVAKVPHIYETFENIVTVNINNVKNTYLCGILMDKIEALKFPDCKEFCQFHPAFGLEFDEEDIDRIHYVNDKIELKEFRGFYGSVDYLSEILEARNIEPEKYIENLVVQMAKTLKVLLINGVNPADIEFVIDNDLKLWILDFGLCFEINPFKTRKELQEFLNKKGIYGLKDNMYIPVYSYLKNIFENEFLKIE